MKKVFPEAAVASLANSSEMLSSDELRELPRGLEGQINRRITVLEVVDTEGTGDGEADTVAELCLLVAGSCFK